MKTSEAKNKIPLFPRRFNELRGEKTQEEFAIFLGISRPTVGFYENGDRIPDAFILMQIAQRCNVTTDWLVGLTDVKALDINLANACAYTGLSEKAICAIRDIDYVLSYDPNSGNQVWVKNSSNRYLLSNVFSNVLSQREFEKVKIAIKKVLLDYQTSQDCPESTYSKQFDFFESGYVLQSKTKAVDNLTNDPAFEEELRKRGLSAIDCRDAVTFGITHATDILGLFLWDAIEAESLRTENLNQER